MEAATNRPPSLTINHFVKTQEGQMLIANQQVFCLGGILYQGYRGSVITVQEKQLSEEELQNLYDVDQSKDEVMKTRDQRLRYRNIAREEELAEREAKRIEKESHRLSVAKLRQELGEDAPASSPSANSLDDRIAALENENRLLKRQLSEGQGKSETHVASACPRCGKRAPDGHKSPARWLTGHNIQCKLKNGDDGK